jgi:5-methylcytosine-specific restriction endonuclease McrA
MSCNSSMNSATSAESTISTGRSKRRRGGRVRKRRLPRPESYTLAGPTRSICASCRLDTFLYLMDIDHVKALGLGGVDVEDNRQPLCLVCHRVKSSYEVRVCKPFHRDLIRACDDLRAHGVLEVPANDAIISFIMGPDFHIPAAKAYLEAGVAPHHRPLGGGDQEEARTPAAKTPDGTGMLLSNPCLDESLSISCSEEQLQAEAQAEAQEQAQAEAQERAQAEAQEREEALAEAEMMANAQADAEERAEAEAEDTARKKRRRTENVRRSARHQVTDRWLRADARALLRFAKRRDRQASFSSWTFRPSLLKKKSVTACRAYLRQCHSQESS